MEASQNPQLPIDEGPTQGTVRVLGDRIVVEDLTISDSEAARVIRERAEAGEEPARAVRRAVEIGTRVLDREDTAIEVDYVRREFERLTPGAQRDRRGDEPRGGRADRGRTAARARWRGGPRRPRRRPSRPTPRSSPSRSPRPSARTARARCRRRSSGCWTSATRSSCTASGGRRRGTPSDRCSSTLRNWTKERKEDQDQRDEKLEYEAGRAAEQGRGARGPGPEPRGPGGGRGGRHAQGPELRGAGRPRPRADRLHPGRRLLAHRRRRAPRAAARRATR